MNKSTKFVVAGIATVALAGGIGVGVAAADPTPTPSPTATSSPSAGTPDPKTRAEKKADRTKDGKHRRNLMTKALHGEATLGGKKHRVVVFQRGTVEKVSTTSITVSSTDGFTATYVIDAKTTVHKNKAKTTTAEVKTADRVRVIATKDGATLTASKIGDRGPK